MTDWSEEDPTPELVKQTVTMFDVVEMLGVEINSQNKVTSPWNPDERTPSCHIYEDHFFDYSSGRGGDVIAFVQALVPGLSFGKAMRKIWHRSLRSGKEPGDVETSEPRAIQDFTDEFSRTASAVNNGACHYWQGLLKVRIPPQCRGDIDHLYIPHKDPSGIYGVKVRGHDGSKTAWPGSQFSKRLYNPFGWNTDYKDAESCFIAEGETDCWALAGAFRPGGWTPTGFALPSGAGTWRDHWLEDLKPFNRIYLCFDNDQAGKNARDKITGKVGYLRAEQLYVPPLYNDAREAIAAGWRPEHKLLNS